MHYRDYNTDEREKVQQHSSFSITWKQTYAVRAKAHYRHFVAIIQRNCRYLNSHGVIK